MPTRADYALARRFSLAFEPSPERHGIEPSARARAYAPPTAGGESQDAPALSVRQVTTTPGSRRIRATSRHNHAWMIGVPVLLAQLPLSFLDSTIPAGRRLRPRRETLPLEQSASASVNRSRSTITCGHPVALRSSGQSDPGPRGCPLCGLRRLLRHVAASVLTAEPLICRGDTPSFLLERRWAPSVPHRPPQALLQSNRFSCA
jgi:hypothetical protein